MPRRFGARDAIEWFTVRTGLGKISRIMRETHAESSMTGILHDSFFEWLVGFRFQGFPDTEADVPAQGLDMTVGSNPRKPRRVSSDVL